MKDYSYLIKKLPEHFVKDQPEIIEILNTYNEYMRKICKKNKHDSCI